MTFEITAQSLKLLAHYQLTVQCQQQHRPSSSHTSLHFTPSPTNLSKRIIFPTKKRNKYCTIGSNQCTVWKSYPDNFLTFWSDSSVGIPSGPCSYTVHLVWRSLNWTELNYIPAGLHQMLHVQCILSIWSRQIASASAWSSQLTVHLHHTWPSSVN